MFRACIGVFRPSNLSRLSGAPSILWPRCHYESTMPKKKQKIQITTIYDKFPSVIQCYKFPYIPYLSWVNNFKFYTIPCVALCITLVSYFIEIGEYSPDLMETCYKQCALLLVNGLLVSIPGTNFVGSMYANPGNGEVIVSYLNIWGNRVDEKFAPGDLYFEPRENYILQPLNKLYIFLRSHKKKRRFRINFTEADVIDVDLLQTALGEIPESAV